MNQEQSQQIFRVLNVFASYKKLIIGCVIIAIVASLVVYLQTPKTYQASALIMYQQQSVNPTRMSPDVQVRFEEMVSTVSQQVTSRTSLEKMIEQFDLYPEAREKMPLENVIIQMREQDIKIAPEPRSNIFTVSYQGSSPQKVLLVTNALSGKFIEENLKFREELTSETSEYVKEELRMAKTKLDKKEAVMRDYKLKYYNEMPEQRQANISRINALQEQLQSNDNNVQNLEQTRILVQEQISLRKKVLGQNALLNNQAMLQDAGQGEPDSSEGYGPEDVAEIRRSLEALQLKYTDQHPDVKRLQNLLAKLEGSNETSSEKDSQSKQPKIADPQIAQLELQLKEIKLNIASLKRERKDIQNQIEQYKKWAEAAPIREAEWSALTRDYNQLKQHYEILVARNLDAESAKTLEIRQKGSQFKIIDPARQPEKPIKPKFLSIILIAMLLGLGVGCGLSYVLAVNDTTFKAANEIESYLGLPVVCSIPFIYSEKDKKKKRMKSLLWGITLIVVVLAIAAEIIYLWQQGTIVI